MTVESNIQKMLGLWAKQWTVGRWLQAQCGIGPVISAGLLAELDIRVARTVGQFWSFAGLNPDKTWDKGAKRPWNARLKTLAAFKLGECFVKTVNSPNSYYGKLYRERKTSETAQNLQGKFSQQAQNELDRKKFDKQTDAYLWLSGCLTQAAAEQVLGRNVVGAARSLAGAPGSGIQMLPPAHTHARARRYAVKIFLSHLHNVMWRDYFGTEPLKPFILQDPAVGETPTHNHRHYLPPPLWPVPKPGRNLRQLFAETPVKPG